MSTLNTKNLILDTAILLFNTHTASAISSNKVADECNISRGNLYYHFKTKRDIILKIFERFEREMEDTWDGLLEYPESDDLHRVFSRQIKVLWQYRFLQLEVSTLLKMDKRLQAIFMTCRKRHMKKVNLLLQKMIKAGHILDPSPPVTVESLAEIYQLITDHWLLHLDLRDKSLSEQTTKESLSLIEKVFAPYLTPSNNTAV